MENNIPEDLPADVFSPPVEWITDRLPTEKDADEWGLVWSRLHSSRPGLKCPTLILRVKWNSELLQLGISWRSVYY